MSVLAAGAHACGGSVIDAPTGSGSPDASLEDRDAGSSAPGRDAGLQVDASLPDGGAFCNGAEARMQINGEAVSLLNLQGKAIAMNCCDSGQLMIATNRFAAVFYLQWRVPGAGPTGRIDLGALAADANAVELVLGCDPATTSCESAEERFTTGFQGTIDYASDPTGMNASYCLSVTEPAANPHPIIHSLQLYAPKVSSPQP